MQKYLLPLLMATLNSTFLQKAFILQVIIYLINPISFSLTQEAQLFICSLVPILLFLFLSFLIQIPFVS